MKLKELEVISVYLNSLKLILWSASQKGSRYKSRLRYDIVNELDNCNDDKSWRQRQ